MNLAGPRRSGPNDNETTAPVELPHVLVTVAEDGTLTATVDRTPFPSPDGTAWTRATFGPLMDAITKDRTIAVRVEVRESDGSVFTDILRTRKPRPAVAPHCDCKSCTGGSCSVFSLMCSMRGNRLSAWP